MIAALFVTRRRWSAGLFRKTLDGEDFCAKERRSQSLYQD